MLSGMRSRVSRVSRVSLRRDVSLETSPYISRVSLPTRQPQPQPYRYPYPYPHPYSHPYSYP